MSERDLPTRSQVESRLRVLLPPEYHDVYPRLTAAPMKSAGLQFDRDGRVAWNRIWQSFCDLAIAGGPPHKGRLLGPGAPAAIGVDASAHLDVLDELGRGITMASELPTDESPHLGWIRIVCHSDTMAAWMYRAITMENVAVRRDGCALDVPAAPHFRIDKEIKNVVTVVAKTCHYWMGHVPREQKTAIGELLSRLDEQSPLAEPTWHEDGSSSWTMVECASTVEAITLMRTLVTVNVLARREETTVLAAHDHLVPWARQVMA